MLIILLLVCPASGKLIFDGLPFDSKLEFIFLVGVVGFGFAPKTVALLRNWLTSLDRQKLILVFGGLLLLLVVKLLTFVYSPLPSGFEVCYRSVYAPLPLGECEKSYDLPFIATGVNLSAISSVEKNIDFGPVEEGAGDSATQNWRLPFLNDWGRLEPLWLVRLPFSAVFAGNINVESDSWIPIIFSGELQVEVDGRLISATDYVGSPNLLRVSVSKGSHYLTLNYRFSEDKQTTFPEKQPPSLGDYATLRVLQPVSIAQNSDLELDKTLMPMSTYDRASFTSQAFFGLINLISLLIFGPFIFQLARKYFNYFFVGPIIVGSVWLVANFGSKIETLGLNRSLLLIGLIFGIGLWAILQKCPQYAWFYGGSIGLVQVCSNFSNFTTSKWWNVPQFRQRDSDWFVHQGLARMIFTENSLRGGESIFYFQPAMRYLIVLGHLVFGNNDVLMSILLVITLFSTVSIVLRRIETKEQLFLFLPVLTMTSMIILFSEMNMSSYIFNLTTELPTWIILFVFLYLVCTENFSTWRVISLGLVAGLAMNFRPNQVPGWGYVTIVVALGLFNTRRFNSQTKRLLWLLTLAAISTASLSFIHNLYFGRSLVLFSSSGALSQEYPWKILFEMFYDAEARRIVLEKFRSLTMSTVLPLSRDKYWQYTNSFQLMHISWLISLFLAFRIGSRHFLTAVYAVVPIAFLVPMVMFDSSSYFPRHLVIINLSFLFSSTLMLFNAQKIPQIIGGKV